MVKTKLTNKEHMLCLILEKGYLARNKFGQLSYYVNKPVRNRNTWYGGNGFELRPDIFPAFSFITYEEDPIEIEKLLELDYEKER